MEETMHVPHASRTHMLCERILHEVAASHDTIMREAKVDESSQLYAAQQKKSIDVVISGGGLKGYYVTGASVVLQREMIAHDIEVSRAAGTSAGAWAAMFLILGITIPDWIETYYACQDRQDVVIHEAYSLVIPWLKQRLPKNSYEICSGRLFISITEISLWGGLQHRVISHFQSNDDLYEACLASSTIPILSEKGGLRKYRDMWVLDGGLTSNLPIFEDFQRPQLVFNLSHVHYPFKLLISPTDPCIESLVIKGAMMMARFLRDQHLTEDSNAVPKLPDKSITWYDPEKARRSKIKYSQPSTLGKIVRLLLPPVLLGSVAWTLSGVTDHQSARFVV